MKQIKRIIMPGLAILIVMLSATPIAANAKSPSYVLECRGGGRMFATIFNVGNIEVLGFRSARTAAGVRPPNAGECAWLDRPMSKNEPLRLFYSQRKLPFFHTSVYANRTQFRWRRDHPMTTVLKAIQGKKIFFVHVRKKRIGKRWMLKIERVGP